jgi:peroxiredoxin Q/BCP
VFGDLQLKVTHRQFCDAKSWQVSSSRQLAYGLFASLFLMPLFAAGATLKVGDRAPDFALPDQDGKIIKLSDFRGKKAVVLAFYIRASTPG